MQLPATVATVLVHTAIYTVYLHLHCASIYFLKRKRKNGSSNTNSLPTIAGSMILFGLITAQWALTISDTFAFFEATRSWPLDDIINSSPMVYDRPHGESKMALYIAQTVVGDGFFAYRLYLVYGQRWVVLIAPVFFILAFVACGILNILWGITIVLLYPMFVSTVMYAYPLMWLSHSRIAVQPEQMRLLLSDAPSCSGMITFKVWKTNRAIAVSLGADPLGSSKAKSMALTIGPMIGIAFSLIIILVGLGKSTESSSDMPAPTLLVFRRSNHGDEAGGVYEMSSERAEEYVGEVDEGGGGLTKRQSKPVPLGGSAASSV
ncbi:hypothetical protein EYR38_009155 [Pleurotus pulmonarius]|nr:hypothetical protein EYR38_009155 [Pleurotus pulmonarius]